MKDWIPFFQTLVWPVFLALFLILCRDWVAEILSVIKAKIEGSSDLRIGPAGLQISEAPKLKSSTKLVEEELLLSKTKNVETVNKCDTLNSIKDIENSFYLIHSAEFLKTAGPSYDRRNVYLITVQISSDNETLLDKIEKVVYIKHHSFKNPKEVIYDRENSFEFVERLWGQFNLKAEVYFKNKSEPLVLYRYLNF